VAASQFVISRLFKSLPYNISLSKENRCRIYPCVCDPKELSFFCDNDHFYTQKCILKRLQTLKCHCNRHTRTHTQTVCNTAGSFARPCSNRFTSRVVRPHKCLSGCCPTVPARPGPAAWCQRDFFGSRKGRSTTTLPNASRGGRSVVIGFVYSPRIPDKPPPPDVIPPWTNQLFPHTHSGLESTRQSLSAFLQNSFL